MALDKQFKVKDTINVGVSGLFGSGIRIGDGSTYPSPVPAIDAWGPIVSGGRDLAMFIGDGIDNIRETAYVGGDVTGDGTKTLLALALEDDIQSRQLPSGTDKDGAVYTTFTQIPGNAVVTTIPSEYLPEKQGTIQYQTQENSSSIYNAQTDQWESNNVWSTVEVLGLQGYDSPTFTNLALSGTGSTGSTTAVISGANTIIIDPGGIGNDDQLIDGAVRIKGDFYVDGTTTTINATTISLSDTILELGTGDLGDATIPAEGLGIKPGGVDTGLLYHGSSRGWELSGSSYTVLDDFMVGTAAGDNFKVTGATGALSAAGGGHFDGTLHVDGATTIDDSLTLSGALTVKSNGSDAKPQFVVTQAGNATLSGNFAVSKGTSDEALVVDSTTGEVTLFSATVEDLTDNRIVIVGASNSLEDDANFRFDGTNFQIGALNSEKFQVGVSTGATTISGAVTLGSSLTLETAAGATVAAIGANGDLSIGGSSTLSGDLVIASDAAGAGVGATNFSVTQAGAMTVSGNSKLGGDVLVEAGGKEAVKINSSTGDVSIAGTTTLSGDITVKTDAGVENFAVAQTSGNVAVSGSAAIKGATTIDNTLTIAGISKQTESIDSTHFTLTDVFSGSSGANGTAMVTPIATFTVTNLNTAKYILTIGEPGGSNITAIELLCVSDGSSVNGTAYGQVEIGTEQLFDLAVEVDGGNVTVSVSGAAENTPVIIQGTAHYNSH